MTFGMALYVYVRMTLESKAAKRILQPLPLFEACHMHDANGVGPINLFTPPL